MNDYEARQERRREKLLARADRYRALATREFDKADLREEKSGIPFGQPILVGHHSERRHRRAIERADAAMARAVAASKAAGEAAAAADAVGTAGISSDDPDAVAKLRERLAKAEADQEMMASVNKLVRAALRWVVQPWTDGKTGEVRGDGVLLIYQFRVARGAGAKAADVWGYYPDEGEAESALQAARLKEMAPAKLPEKAVLALLQPDFAGRFGFAGYQLTNNGANIRRLKERIALLERNAGRETKETTHPSGVRIVENAEANRLQLFFPGKPDAEVRAALKGRGFRWSPTEGAWQRMLGNGAKWAAEDVLKGLPVAAS